MLGGRYPVSSLRVGVDRSSAVTERHPLHREERFPGRGRQTRGDGTGSQDDAGNHHRQPQDSWLQPAQARRGAGSRGAGLASFLPEPATPGYPKKGLLHEGLSILRRASATGHISRGLARRHSF